MSVTGRVSDVSKAQWWLTPRTMREPRPWCPPSPTGGGSASCTGTRPSTTGNFTAGSLTWGAWEEQVEVEAPLPRPTSVQGGRTMTGTPCKYRDHTPHTSHLTPYTSYLTTYTSHFTLHTLHLKTPVSSAGPIRLTLVFLTLFWMIMKPCSVIGEVRLLKMQSYSSEIVITTQTYSLQSTPWSRAKAKSWQHHQQSVGKGN